MSSVGKKLHKKKSFIKLLENNSEEKHTAAHSRSTTRRPKGSSSKKKPSQQQVKDMLRESYNFVKEENEFLTLKLKKKDRKIEELRQTVRDYQEQVKLFEASLTNYHSEKRVLKTKESEEALQNSRKRYEQMIREAQELARLSIEKYRKLEKEFQEEQTRHQTEISKLKEALQKQDRMQVSTGRKKTQSHHRSHRKEASPEWASQHKEWREREREWTRRQRDWQGKEQAWIKKEEELRQMLSSITQRINSFEGHYRASEDKAKDYKNELEALEEKYQLRCRRQKEAMGRWGGIFRELMGEAKELGKQIETSKRMFYEILKLECSRLERHS